MTASGKLGIIAGGGNAPLRVVESCQAQGRAFHLFCLEGQANSDIFQNFPHTWLHLGAFGKLRDLVVAEGISEIIMIGHVRRPSMTEIKPDWLAIKALAKIGMSLLGDDALLRAIGKAIEEECGVRVLGVQDVLGGVLAPIGAVGNITPDEQAMGDIKRGFDVAKILGQADVGQSVIVQQGLVLGVEAIEGTDALISRCKELHREGVGGILIKAAKPQQDDRFDLPTIGVNTVIGAAEAGLRGIAIEAERSLIIDREMVKKTADEKGIFVFGVLFQNG